MSRPQLILVLAMVPLAMIGEQNSAASPMGVEVPVTRVLALGRIAKDATREKIMPQMPEEARRILEPLPLVRSRVLEFELIPPGPLSPLNVLLRGSNQKPSRPE